MTNETYRSIFEHAIEGIFRSSPNGTFVQANKALARIYGYNTPEALKAAITDIATQIYVDPSRRDTFIQMMHDHGMVSGFVSQVYRKDGSIVWVSENAHAITDDDGNICYYEGFVIDITENTYANELLRKREEKYGALLRVIPDWMFLINHDGILLEYTEGNDHAPLLKTDHLTGCKIEDILPSDIAIQAKHYLKVALETGVMQVFEYPLFVQDIPHDYEVRIVVSGQDEVLAIVRDITERKKAERLKNEFVSIVSHELRTPLTSIRGSLGLIAGAMANELPQRVKAMVNIAHKNSERLVSLVNDILDIDKIESGNMVFNMKTINLIPVIEQSLEANADYGQQYHVSFVLQTELQEVNVYADADRLMQVLANLLSNAAKFSPANSEVFVIVARHHQTIRVSVKDQGPGIPEEFRPQMFQKFAQADSSDTRQKGGSGLGLSISKAIIERHNGKMGFDTMVNRGTTFFFELPEWQEEEVTYGNIQHKPRILICEDTPDLASMLSIMLNYSGFQTDIAYNTTQAKQFLENNQYAAMTLDLVMPGQSGIDFIRELRSQERTRHLPIVVISAIAQQGRQELEGGAFEIADWLDKTVDHNQLNRSIRRAIMRHSVEKPRVLHVEDDEDVVQVVAAILQEIADISHATTIQEAHTKLEQEPFDVVVLDLSLPDGSGLELLTLLRDPNRKPIPVLIFSAKEIDSETAHKVTAALVKSRTSNQELMNTIKSLIGE
jgi:PAS domain S-box-containing protein